VIVVGKKSEDARRLHRSLGDDFPDFGYSIMMSKSGSSSRFTVLSLQSPIKVRVELQSMTTADRDEILKQSLIKLQELKGKFNHKNPFFIWLSSKCDVYGIEDKLEDNDSGYGLFIQVSLNDQGYLEYKGVAPDRNKVFLDDKGKKDTTGLFFEGAARLLISKYNAAVSDSKGSGPRSNIAPGQKIVITRKDPKSLQN
jgi:hypothetical protein